MDYFAQQLINGLVLGSIYGLIAIGYTMVYGIVGMINFAHGDIFMIGGFIALITFLVLVLLVFTLPDRRKLRAPATSRRVQCWSTHRQLSISHFILSPMDLCWERAM
jgi:branched-subunit amino acid ABC-type transport system permease component